MSPLPHDIHVDIIDWVYRSSQHAGIDYETLGACSLVCKSWTGPSQRLVFRRTSILNHMEQLQRLLTVLIQNPLLPTYVRSINYVFHAAADTNENFFTLITLCSSVSNLSLFPIAKPSETLELMDRIRGMHLPITSLHTFGGPGIVSGLASLWPGLRCLAIGDFVMPQLDFSTVPFSTPRGLQMHFRGTGGALLTMESTDVSALRELEVVGGEWDPRLTTRTALFRNLTALILDGALPPQRGQAATNVKHGRP
ncbi:hypothetical protein FA95DRAFT_1607587 [Auriscalpium vulgare]|uniref:Uncharacterized protein n=1 Tax=Auriscalpium vulgare TaxID=40419 RepID=A0ACB8RPW4_9AGAM|nr:hypothetical protein FA95DRAFT_1607587 [Auriscalpium vulgare]